ncbi:uncharacterized protein [Palaemon carinicauda]|uniref:uncharacterized protein n=1 Tax=Palaemon carinicauda TaxID=392227 RepID=UPI0035B6198C
MRHITKSTTLFPGRVHSAFSLCKKLEDSAEFFKPDIGVLENNTLEKSDTENCRVQQSPEVKWQRSIKPSVTMASKPSVKNASSGGSETSPKRRKILPMTSLKCFLCNKIIKIENLSEHLLFGLVNCNKCPAVFQNCQQFQIWKVEHKKGKHTCEHVLQYSVDPLRSLELHLSNQYLENGTSCKTSLIDKPHHLRAYVNGMDSLKKELPWREAVLRFKQDRKKPRDRKLKLIKEDSYGVKPSNCNNSGDNGAVNSTVNSFSEYNSPPHKTVPAEHDAQNSDDKVQVSVAPQLGSLGMSNDKQNQDVPSSLPSSSPIKNSPNKNSHGDLGFQNTKKKPEARRRRKTEWISGIRKRNPTPKSSSSVSYVETPPNGFYYVVRHAVSECPNCYAKISPRDFTVNIKTFLMTAVCADCSLTIYIVHDPPDDSSPRVCIVTGQEKRHAMRKKTSQKSLKQTTVIES